MLNENTILIGQVLQIRDKLVAKRHSIPSSLIPEWKQLSTLTSVFDQVNAGHPVFAGGTSLVKPKMFRGTAKDLMEMVTALKTFERKVSSAMKFVH